MRVPIDGGAAQKVTDRAQSGLFRHFSRRQLGCLSHGKPRGRPRGKAGAGLQPIPARCGKLLKFERGSGELIRFSRDGKAVVYAVRENGVDNLWQQPLDGSPGKQITSFTSERIYDFHWSFDGSRLALVRGHTDSDVVLMRKERQ